LYRKFTADYIFTGYEMLSAPTVLITDGSGVIIDLVNIEEAGDGIEEFNGIISPGFVNAHCHLELSHLKGRISENTGLVEFVQQVMNNRSKGNEQQLEAMEQADSKMYHSGIVAVGDICNSTDSIAVKKSSKILWHNFIEVSGFVGETANARLEAMKLVSDQFKNELPFQPKTLSPHAPYSVSKKLFHLLNEQTEAQLITIHNQESAAEDELYLAKQGGFLALYNNFEIDISSFEPTGKSSVQSWLPYFNKQQSILSVHNTYTSESDIDFLIKYSEKHSSLFSYCICINANNYIEQKNPPIEMLMNSDCNVVIGTDSLASNHQLNILEELKTIQLSNNPIFPLSILLKWATINGAKALQLDSLVGSFEKGKKPGVVLIENIQQFQLNQQSSARRIV
jgi:cytosine/adenosine deaminase-related metal-dependent hydrolase